MKKLFIAAILLAAAGSVFYYYKQFKKENHAQLNSHELIIGNWLIDSLSVNAGDSVALLITGLMPMNDSDYFKYNYQFCDDGTVVKSLAGRDADTSAYLWKENNVLYWKEKQADSSGEQFQVVELDSNKMSLQTKDSVGLFFKKIK